jgi:two-component system sensor histidine kinase EvgS
MRGLRAPVRIALTWCLALLASAATPVSAQTAGLTVTEQQWVAAHPVLQVVVVRDEEPLYSVGDGKSAPQGFGIDLLSAVAHRAGLALDYHTVDNVGQAMAELASGRADLTPMAAPSPERLKMLSFPGAFVAAEQVIVARSDVGDISSAQNFAGRRVAIVDGTAITDRVVAEFPDANFVHAATRLEAYRAIADGRADLAPGWLQDAVYTIEANLLSNLRVKRSEGAAVGSFGPAVTQREPVLSAILAKGIASLSAAERNDAARRWLPLGVDSAWVKGKAQLTDSERAWIQRAGAIRLGYDEHFAPFTSRGALDTFNGLGADMVRLAADKVGLRVIAQRGGTFADVYDAARNGQLDVIVGMARTEARRADFEFIGPFSTSPTAMVMRSDDPRTWSEPDDIRGGTLGLLREHFLIAQLHSRRPALHLAVFDSQEEVLHALDDGRVDAAIGNGVVVNQLIDQRYAGRLRVAGVMRNGDSELYFGVPRAQPELARLLQKGLDAITPSEAAELQRHWVFVSLQPGLRWRDVLKWALPATVAAAFGLALLAVANRRLRRANAGEHAAREAAEQATAARGRFLSYLAHELRGSLGGISAGAAMLRDTTDPSLQHRLTDAMKASADGLQQLLETTLAHERTMAGGIELQPAPTELRPWWNQMMAPLRLSAQAKGLELRDEAPASELPLDFDAVRLAQALTNVIGNAIKFTPSGAVDVKASWSAADGVLRVRVIDSGPGIAAHDRAQIFVPYAQGEAGRSASRGAGLGLSITREILRAMGGEIALAPAAAQGAEFVVRVPLRA